MKKKYTRRKYDIGTQEVIVPEKGGADDVLGDAAALGATGATLGSVAGPWGTVIGGVVGAGVGVGTGLAKAGKKTAAHNQAVNTNNYIRTMNRTDNPQLQNFQAKKGLDLSKYPDGTSSIKLQPEEIAQLDSLKADPNAYRTSLWNMMGYNPKRYPAGSEGWKQQNSMYDSAVNYVNQGYRPFTKTNSKGNLVSGYTKLYEDGTNNIDTSDGIKPIEVEKDELVFSRTGRNYKLRADFKGGKTHEEGGEPFVAKEGDVIYPGHMRNKVTKAYNRGDFAALESMRLKLPKDTNANKAEDGLSYDERYNRGYGSQDYAGMNRNDYLTGYNEAMNPESANAPVENNNTGFNINKGANVATGIIQAAPTIYNTARGAFGKAQQPARRFYTPNKFIYNDLSDPNRRLSREQYAVDKYNTATVNGSRGQTLSYLSQAGINNYKRQSDINNYEIGRKSELNNLNTQQSNQAGLTNLELANQYDDQALRNEAKRTEYLGNAVEGASKLAYNRQLTTNLQKRDNTLIGLAKTQHYGYEDGIGAGYYAPDGSFVSGGKTYFKDSNNKYQYRKGSQYISTRKK